MDSKRSRQKQRLKNWRVTRMVPRTDSDFARRNGIEDIPGPHYQNPEPVRQKLAKCVGF